jgi:hypothetical protein
MAVAFRKTTFRQGAPPITHRKTARAAYAIDAIHLLNLINEIMDRSRIEVGSSNCEARASRCPPPSKR